MSPHFLCFLWTEIRVENEAYQSAKLFISNQTQYSRVAVGILVVTLVILHSQLHVANFASKAFLVPVLDTRTSILTGTQTNNQHTECFMWSPKGRMLYIPYQDNWAFLQDKLSYHNEHTSDSSRKATKCLVYNFGLQVGVTHRTNFPLDFLTSSRGQHAWAGWCACIWEICPYLVI